MADIKILARLARRGRVDQLVRIAAGYYWLSAEADHMPAIAIVAGGETILALATITDAAPAKAATPFQTSRQPANGVRLPEQFMSTAITIEQAREANRALGTLDHIEAFLRGKGLDLQAADLARANTRITPVVLAALDTLGMKSPPPSEIAI